MRILFILKKNEIYGSGLMYTRRSSGLYNSTRFIIESLCERGIDAKIVEVQDNNCIDREVAAFRPHVVIIEALWVVPEKFHVLKKLHPHVKWYIHLHSHMPFLALEGIAMGWILEYARDGIGLIANSAPSYDALSAILRMDQLIYLPNVYLSRPREYQYRSKDVLDIGCFGAMRPMKNHLLQALAAIEFAKDAGMHLRFHINGTRVEVGGDPVLKNLRQLFAGIKDAELVESKWNEPEDFLKLLECIDIGMQVSMTETFNVVCADYVTAGIPVVASKEVAWLSDICKAKDDDINDIVEKMIIVDGSAEIVFENQKCLLEYSAVAQDAWYFFCRRH